MNDINILIREEGKYLKLNFDRFIFWTSYIDSLCSKLSSQLFCLVDSPSIKKIPSILRLVYTSLIQSRLIYGIILGISTSGTNFL